MPRVLELAASRAADLMVFWISRHMDGLEAEPFFREQLFGLICARLGRRFEVERIYANGQTALQQGTPHFDLG